MIEVGGKVFFDDEKPFIMEAATKFSSYKNITKWTAFRYESGFLVEINAKEEVK